MRTFITAIEETGNSTFIYEQFPSTVSGIDIHPPA
jgi:hypothetical protein